MDAALEQAYEDYEADLGRKGLLVERDKVRRARLSQDATEKFVDTIYPEQPLDWRRDVIRRMIFALVQ